jgi:dephospho-CoA kinase
VGLVGGIGSGKSTVARELARRMKATILDADKAGHEALRQRSVKDALRTAFGDGVFDGAGEVVRSQLAQLVFGDDEVARQNRRTLEAIVHPVLRADLVQQWQTARDQRLVEVVLLDAPILLESGWKELCDAVVFIDTPLSRRQLWTKASRGWSAEELARREASQWPIARKQSESDFIIDNSGMLFETVQQLERAVREVISRKRTPDKSDG